MDSMNGLDRYELLIIGIIILGLCINFSGILLYSYSNYKLHNSDGQFGIDDFHWYMKMGSGQTLLGAFIYGVGFFLVFKRLNKVFKIHKCFDIINYSYLVFLFPLLIHSIFSYPFMESYSDHGLFDSSGLVVYNILSLVKIVLFFSMILLIAVKIFGKYRPPIVTLEEYRKMKEDHGKI